MFAAAQFAGRSNGLARATKSGGTLLPTEDCGACGGWRITRFDETKSPEDCDNDDEGRQSGRC